MENKNLDELLYKKMDMGEKARTEDYGAHYIEQYKIYVNVFNSTSDRRNKANEFFLGLNAAIIGILGYVETKSVAHPSVIFILAPIAGIAICYCWYRLICAYRQLNRAKFKVIHHIEDHLPVSLFRTEWHVLGKGKDKSKYYPLSQIEKNIPIIFILLYLVILFLNLNFTQLVELLK